MDRVAVFVDAGYLYAGGSYLLAGESKKRTEIRLDVKKAVEFLSDVASQTSSCPLLRIYWYDGALAQGLTTEQQIGYSDNVKLKLGVLNSSGQQKEVDSQIVNDLAELSRRRAICDGVLIGGDGDLRLGVELAQEKGVRVHVLAFDKNRISPHLRREADTVQEISREDLHQFLSIIPTLSTAPPTIVEPSQHDEESSATPSSPDDILPEGTSGDVDRIIEEVVNRYVQDLSGADRLAFSEAVALADTIPREHDGRILATAGSRLGRYLDTEEANYLRRTIREVLLDVEDE